MNNHPIKSFTGIAPLVMSAYLGLMLAINAVVPLGPDIPIHDEYGWDHMAMLAFFGQVPIMLAFIVVHTRQIKSAAPVFALQLSLWGAALAVAHHENESSRAAVVRRLEANTALAGSAGALRTTIEGLQTGKPDYSSMDGYAGDYISHRLRVAAVKVKALGPVRSLDFKGVDHSGWDVYDVHFTNGDAWWSVYMTPNGRIHGLAEVDAPDSCSSSEVYECREARAWPPWNTMRAR